MCALIVGPSLPAMAIKNIVTIGAAPESQVAAPVNTTRYIPLPRPQSAPRNSGRITPDKTRPVEVLPLSTPLAAKPTKTPAASGTSKRTKPYNVVILGDSLGDGLWAGLYRVLRKDKRFHLIKRSKVSSGFVRTEYYDWNKQVRNIVNEEKVDIAVVLMGTNDRQVIVDKNGKRHRLRQPGWETEYRDRATRFSNDLNDAGARIFWVGLPAMRSPRFGGDMQYFNGIYSDLAKTNNYYFVPTWDRTLDAKTGKYNAYGPDLRGRNRLLRADDGIHFTLAGYQSWAKIVADELLAQVDSGFPYWQHAALEDEKGAPAGKIGVDSAMVDTLRGRVYEQPEIKPGRSDDWRWPESQTAN